MSATRLRITIAPTNIATAHHFCQCDFCLSTTKQKHAMTSKSVTDQPVESIKKIIFYTKKSEERLEITIPEVRVSIWIYWSSRVCQKLDVWTLDSHFCAMCVTPVARREKLIWSVFIFFFYVAIATRLFVLHLASGISTCLVSERTQTCHQNIYKFGNLVYKRNFERQYCHSKVPLATSRQFREQTYPWNWLWHRTARYFSC